MKETIIIYFLQCKEQIKLQHWNTFSYSTHKTTDDLYSELSELIDEFVEVMMGKYGRPDFPDTFPLQMEKPENVDIMEYLSQFAEYLMEIGEDPIITTELLNIRDEMLSAINQAKYLLTLNK
jgi:DNA-binding ferritin-like protein